MTNIIKIIDNNGTSIVSARELYEFLEVNSNFTTWCKRMFEYGFEEGKDFIPILEESTGGRPSVNYALTIDTAKEISMLQRSEKGKQARQYFIDCEKMLRSNTQVPMTKEQLYMQTFQMLSEDVKALEMKNQELECIVLAQDKKLESKSAKEDFTDHITSEEEFSLTVTSIGSRLNINGKKLNKILLEKHVIRSLDDDYCLTTKYLGKGYAKRILIKCHDGQFREKLRWSRFGEAFIVDLIKGLDRSKYKIQHIPISQNSSIIH